MGFYDGTKLLSMRDLDGNEPELYICTTNRNGGKTTYFNRLLVNRFLKNGRKFGAIYRYKYELDNCANTFFNTVQELFFPDHQMRSRRQADGIYHELLLDGKVCGYAVAINAAEGLKKVSHLLSDIDSMVFDEFQSESGNYCSNEINKFQSLHTSIARGHGKQVRRVPVYMLSNFVSLLNPYYTTLGISDRLQSNTKFLRGHGWVLEAGHVESAAEALKSSGFNRAFAGGEYVQYSTENVYLNDATAFVERVNGSGRYIATIKYDDKFFSIKEFPEQGVIYCDDSYDPTFPRRIALTTADHQLNYVMLANNSFLLTRWRELFTAGAFRFKNLRCKEAIIKALSI